MSTYHVSQTASYFQAAISILAFLTGRFIIIYCSGLNPLMDGYSAGSFAGLGLMWMSAFQELRQR